MVRSRAVSKREDKMTFSLIVPAYYESCRLSLDLIFLVFINICWFSFRKKKYYNQGLLLRLDFWTTWGYIWAGISSWDRAHCSQHNMLLLPPAGTHLRWSQNLFSDACSSNVHQITQEEALMDQAQWLTYHRWCYILFSIFLIYISIQLYTDSWAVHIQNKTKQNKIQKI